MRIQIQYRNLNPSKKISDYAKERMGKAARYLIKRGRAELFLAQKGHVFQVEATFHTGGRTLHSRGTGENLFAAIDAAAEKLHKQGLKIKKKVQHHKNYEKSREGRLFKFAEPANASPEPFEAYETYEDFFEDAA